MVTVLNKCYIKGHNMRWRTLHSKKNTNGTWPMRALNIFIHVYPRHTYTTNNNIYMTLMNTYMTIEWTYIELRSVYIQRPENDKTLIITQIEHVETSTKLTIINLLEKNHQEQETPCTQHGHIFHLAIKKQQKEEEGGNECYVREMEMRVAHRSSSCSVSARAFRRAKSTMMP